MDARTHSGRTMGMGFLQGSPRHAVQAVGCVLRKVSSHMTDAAGFRKMYRKR